MNGTKTVSCTSSFSSIAKILLVMIILSSLGCSISDHFRGAKVVSAPFSGTVVDEETERPLEGVVVVVTWPMMTSTFGGVHSVGLANTLEAVTDKNGVYRIPGWEGAKEAVGKGGFRDSDPEAHFFKAGYWPKRINNSINSDKTFPKGEPWVSEWDGKRVRLKPMHSENWSPKEWEKHLGEINFFAVPSDLV